MHKLFLTAIICCIATAASFAQQTPATGLSNFKILVESTKDEIKLTCTEGCAFKQLTFAASTYWPYVINVYGMEDIRDTTSPPKVENMPYFLFTIEKTKEGLSFTGVTGTAWEDLSFSCNGDCKQWIDEFGMAEK